MANDASQTPPEGDGPDPRFSHPKVREDDARGAPPGQFGQPAYEPTEEQRQQVRTLAQVFPPKAQRYIAIKMGFSYQTLMDHFRDDLDKGRAEMLAAVGSQFVSRAIDAERVDDRGRKIAKGDIEAQKYVLARLAGWTVQQEISGPGGGPIEHRVEVDLTKFSAQDLANYGRLSAIQAGLDPDKIVAVPIDD